MITVRFRFYEELNIYLPITDRKKWVEFTIDKSTPVFKALKQLHIPLDKIDLILINDISVDFNTLLKNGDRIAVYPVFELLDISEITKLRTVPLREPKFICDVHLGKLCKYLRVLGFDTYFDQDSSLDDLIQRSRIEHRILLSRNNHISKLQQVTHFYRVRSTNPDEQLKDLINKLDLYGHITTYTRCLRCNSRIEPIPKEKISNLIYKRTREHYNEFFICKTCHKIYWKGTHCKRMLNHVNNLLKK